MRKKLTVELTEQEASLILSNATEGYRTSSLRDAVDAAADKSCRGTGDGHDYIDCLARVIVLKLGRSRSTGII